MCLVRSKLILFLFLSFSVAYCAIPNSFDSGYVEWIDIWIALPANKPSHQLSTNSQSSGIYSWQ